MSDDRILINQYYRVLKCVIGFFFRMSDCNVLVYLTLVFLIVGF